MSQTTSSTLDQILAAGVKLTPMMEQYYQIKKNYPQTLVFFRMGDFYEVFFEDAQKTTRLLNITLTHRGKLGDFPIPMAGIPHHAASTYIDRLTGMGEKVAICEQIEDPKEAKGIVQRAVTQVVSPGMPFDLERAEARANHFMAAASFQDGIYSIAFIDFTTGEFFGHQFEHAEELLERYRLIAPKEFVQGLGQWDETLPALQTLHEQLGVVKTHLSSEYFDPKFTDLYIEKLIPAYKKDKIIALHSSILSPIGALAYYICSTQDRDQYIHIHPFQLVSDAQQMKVSQPTLAGLEILPKSRELYKDSLLGFFDKTQSALGSRMLKKVFLNPLYSEKEILNRQQVVGTLLQHPELREELREKLCKVRDLERIMAKVATTKATAGDLLNTAISIEVEADLQNVMEKLPAGFLTPLKAIDKKKLLELQQEIQKTLNEEIGASLEKGNLIKAGAVTARDKLAKKAYHAAEELLQLEARYRSETGVQKLRIKSNNVAGYFIEVSKGQSDQLPARFRRRQTLVNCERFTTDELDQFEKEILAAREKLERLEREIFKALIEKVSDNRVSLRALAQNLGLLDVFQSLATVAWQEELTCPEISKEKKLSLKGTWHPLIKNIIRDQFVTHDLSLDEAVSFGLITGPNMAGKTTVMREVAIVQLLTQIGSYVPAQKAHLSLCDFLFSRLGASDDILKGQSTFMVEMAETAEILRHATERSLIILDEVGRGTSTYDGLSIAWALVEHFVKRTQALTLFATHYHELIEVVENLPNAKNLTVETISKDGHVQFLYRLIEKGASQSFGIYVAKLAGLPQSVLARSQELLHQLESDQVNQPQTPLRSGTQLSFFPELQAEPEIPKYLTKLQGELQGLDIYQMTPLQALQKLQDLKDQLPLQ